MYKHTEQRVKGLCTNTQNRELKDCAEECAEFGKKVFWIRIEYWTFKCTKHCRRGVDLLVKQVINIGFC